MEILVAACVTVWGMVAVYVGWMGVQQRRLATRLHNLETARETTTMKSLPQRKAA